MADLSDYAENLVAKWLLTADGAPRPTSWYLALFVAPPSDAGGGTEVSSGGYARQAVTFTASGSVASNSGEIAFTAVGGDYGTITHVGIFDALTSGNLIAWIATTSRSVTSGNRIYFPAGEVTVTFA